MSQQSIEEACRTACESIGVIYKPVPFDGLFHVADLTDDHKGKNDARIKIFPDRQGGLVWNHKSGERETFFVNDSRSGSGEPVPLAERERIKLEQVRRESEQKIRQNKATRRALALWQSAKPAPFDHPYLSRKGVKPHGLKVATWKRSVQDEQGHYHPLIIENALLLPLSTTPANLKACKRYSAKSIPS